MSRDSDSEFTKTWFEKLFGFREGEYAATQSSFEVVGATLKSLRNNQSYGVGTWSTPTLAELREQCNSIALSGKLAYRHIAVTDIFTQHCKPEYRGAMFQVASQFNCLEFVSDHITPEDGITMYERDPTQGPACSLACGAATVYRNYFLRVDPTSARLGQTKQRQVNCLDELEKMLPRQFWRIKGGYSYSTAEDLRDFDKLLSRCSDEQREAMLGAIKIGVQRNVEVTFSQRFQPLQRSTPPQLVSQAFCSAISVSYSGLTTKRWELLARLVLDAVYEATLRAAAISAAQGGSNIVLLTLVGGAAYGNETEWICAAIGRAMALMRNYALDVRIVHYRNEDAEVYRQVERCFAGWCRAIDGPAPDKDADEDSDEEEKVPIGPPQVFPTKSLMIARARTADRAAATKTRTVESPLAAAATVPGNDADAVPPPGIERQSSGTVGALHRTFTVQPMTDEAAKAPPQLKPSRMVESSSDEEDKAPAATRQPARTFALQPSPKQLQSPLEQKRTVRVKRLIHSSDDEDALQQQPPAKVPAVAIEESECILATPVSSQTSTGALIADTADGESRDEVSVAAGTASLEESPEIDLGRHASRHSRVASVSQVLQETPRQ
eukprot:TRINITY_DN11971_c0_g1_i1.p1 TRINITY_DN11971_c0_g1~~TRINITY_DN11971_c0_g1_i1.p1  ORF type:complete len:610 (+),score=129.39 TRINITY_DN11971_c0_g1_i1:38-1867(+)